MAGLASRSFESTGDVRAFDKGRMEVVTLGGATVGRGTFEPGWRWSECVKPIAGTDSCQAAHLGYVVSGRMRVRMDDGTEGEAAAGDVFDIAPGHDAWIVGDEACVIVDFQGASNYART
ncbi:MAG TPA: cupin domain-containing protein [Acidimicrobiales bacterium]|nr:cupin domain-containing protein [Acidimicrobiales bacterium]